MAGPYYVDSAAGGTGSGANWTNAFTLTTGAAAVDAAGDTIYIASGSAESVSGAQTYNWAGTTASPTKIYSADKTSNGGGVPNVATAGAKITTTGSSPSIAWAATGCYTWGVTFEMGSGSSTTASFTTGNFNATNTFDS